MSALSCPACGGGALEEWRVAHEVVAGRPTRAWLLRRCLDCRSAALAEAGTEWAREELYETGTYAPSGPRDGMLAPPRWFADRERLRLLGTIPAAGRVVEVGAGRGRLITALREHGYDAVGIEPSKAASRAAAARGLPVDSVTLEDAEFPPGQADLVVLWHVLEHLADPEEALRRVRPWLKADGRLVVAVPNIGSAQAWIGGDRWFHQDVPRHRTHFTVSGLYVLLRRTGFVSERARHLIIEQNWLGMWLTLLNRLTFDRDVPYRFAKRDLDHPSRREAAWDVLVSVVAGIPLVPISAVLEMGAGLARRGGTVVVHASPAR